MKPAEDLANEIFTGCFCATTKRLKCHCCRMVEIIHQDREAIRKKCAEVARNNFYGIDEICITGCSIALHKYQRDVAKAIEEMELK